jgi:histidine phosphotransfer protein HptB
MPHLSSSFNAASFNAAAPLSGPAAAESGQRPPQAASIQGPTAADPPVSADDRRCSVCAASQIEHQNAARTVVACCPQGLNPRQRDAFPIDWAQLHLLSEGNEEFELELLNIFWTETHSRLQVAQTAVLTADFAALHYVAHQMKGASGNVGLHDVWRIASELEKMAHRADLTGADTLLLELSRCLNYVQAFLTGL